MCNLKENQETNNMCKEKTLTEEHVAATNTNQTKCYEAKEGKCNNTSDSETKDETLNTTLEIVNQYFAGLDEDDTNNTNTNEIPNTLEAPMSKGQYDTNILKDGEVAVIEDVRLTNDDLTCLAPTSWLFDNVIEFNLQYQRNFISKDQKHSIEIISPHLEQIVKLSNKDGLNGLKLHINPDTILSKTIVLIPVNDDSGKGDGSHWSLLILVPNENSFLHIDTNGNSNKKDATAIAYNLLQCMEEDETTYSFSSAYGSSDVMQPNAYDCGIYVLQFARAAQFHFSVNGGDFQSFCPTFRKLNSKETRKSILRRIKKMGITSQQNCIESDK